jgi:hypothetical protein
MLQFEMLNDAFENEPAVVNALKQIEMLRQFYAHGVTNADRQELLESLTPATEGVGSLPEIDRVHTITLIELACKLQQFYKHRWHETVPDKSIIDRIMHICRKYINVQNVHCFDSLNLL